MPFVRISLREGTSPDYRKVLADGVHRALIEAIAIPPGDRFQVITQHPPGDLIYSPDYLGVPRSDRVVFVQITLAWAGNLSKSVRCSSACRKSYRSRPACALRIWLSILLKFHGRTGLSVMVKRNIWIPRVCGHLSFAALPSGAPHLSLFPPPHMVE
jgi:hypothetical protein